ncbi:hypothetical protein Q2T40_02290 [Winogradskyella maritima]|nr:hypothetical protein [Winogradskyella maritima]
MKQLITIGIAIVITAFLGVTNQVNAQSKDNTTVNLDAKQQSIIAIASLTAKGDLQTLESALTEGLDAGLTVRENQGSYGASICLLWFSKELTWFTDIYQSFGRTQDRRS